MFCTSDQTRHIIKALFIAVICFTLTFIFVLSPYQVHAHSAISSANGPTIRGVTIGFNGRYQDSNWVPVHITLGNNGPDFSGKIAIDIPSSTAGYGNSATTATYQTPITLPSGSEKQTTLYLPLSFGNSGSTTNFTVNLLNANNQKVNSKNTSTHSIGSGVLYVGILSDQKSSLGAISQIPALTTGFAVSTETLTPATMPDNATALKNFTMIVLDNFTTSTLSADQLTALQNWVNAGGNLIAIGGPEWERTLSPLANTLLPVNITGTDTLPAGTHLLPTGGPTKSGPGTKQQSDTVQDPVTISVATAHANSTVNLSSETIPLIVQSKQGQGTVNYIAFDPALTPLVNWSNITSLWEGLILRAASQQILSNNQNNQNGQNQSTTYDNSLQQVLQTFFPNSTPLIWLILVLLISYVLILGPIRFFIVRKFKKRAWSWRIILSTILVFTLLSYGLALQQKGTSIISSSVSIIQLSQPDKSGSTEHTTTYLGIFVPNQGNFNVHIPGSNLVKSADQGQYQNNRGQSTQQNTITTVHDGTDVELRGVDIWTMRTLITQHDHHTTGGITSHLTLQNNSISGTISNTLPYAINDAYLLLGNDFLALGNLQVGQTQKVLLKLVNSLNKNPTTNQDPTSLAAQIASSRNLYDNSYNSYYSNSLPQDEPHRHISVLNAISQQGPYCNGPCSGRVTTFRGGSGIIKQVMMMGSQANLQDPLLITGADATVIGWANPASDQNNKVTINGNTTVATQETLVQAPISLNFAGNVKVPTTLTPGQIIDLQQDQNSNNIQEPATDIYTITTGSMTFEFTLPTMPSLQNSALTFTDAANAINVAKGYTPNGLPTATSDINHLQAYLYNWQKNTWDLKQFNQYKFQVDDAQAYIGPGGRILLHLANQDATLGTTIFSQPELQVQGAVS